MADDTEGTDIPSMLLPCVSCNRTFRPEALAKHSKVCEKSLMKKRKKFDSSKQRIQGTELAEFLPILPTFTKKAERSPVRKTQAQTSNLSSTSKPPLSPPKTKWREKHNELVQTIQATRLPPGQAPKMPIKPVDQEQCPYCERTFGPKAYDRHLEWCKEQHIRVQPKSPASQRAKERLEARTKYRAPMMNKARRSVSRDKLPGGKRDPSPSPMNTSQSATTLTPVMARKLSSSAVPDSSPNINKTFVKGTPLRSSTRGVSAAKKTPQVTRLEDPLTNSAPKLNTEEVNKQVPEMSVTSIGLPTLKLDLQDRSVGQSNEVETHQINCHSKFIDFSKQQTPIKDTSNNNLSQMLPRNIKPILSSKYSEKLPYSSLLESNQNLIPQFSDKVSEIMKNKPSLSNTSHIRTAKRRTRVDSSCSNNEVLPSKLIICSLTQYCKEELTETSKEDSFKPELNKTYTKDDFKSLCLPVTSPMKKAKIGIDINRSVPDKIKVPCEEVKDGDKVSHKRNVSYTKIIHSPGTVLSHGYTVLPVTPLEVTTTNYQKHSLVVKRIEHKTLPVSETVRSNLVIFSNDTTSIAHALFMTGACCEHKSYFLDFLGTNIRFCPSMVFLEIEVNLKLPYLNIIMNDEVINLISGFNVSESEEKCINICKSSFYARRIMFGGFRTVFLTVNRSDTKDIPLTYIYEKKCSLNSLQSKESLESPFQINESLDSLNSEELQTESTQVGVVSPMISLSAENCQSTDCSSTPSTNLVKLASSLQTYTSDNTMSEYECGTFWDYYGLQNINTKEVISEEDSLDVSNVTGSESANVGTRIVVEKWRNMAYKSDSDETPMNCLLSNSQDIEYFLGNDKKSTNMSYISQDSLNSKADSVECLSENSFSEKDEQKEDSGNEGDLDTQESEWFLKSMETQGYRLPLSVATNKIPSIAERAEPTTLEHSTELCILCKNKLYKSTNVEMKNCLYSFNSTGSLSKEHKHQAKDINFKGISACTKYLCSKHKKTKIPQPLKLPNICKPQKNSLRNIPNPILMSKKQTFEDIAFPFELSHYSKYYVGSKLPEVKHANFERIESKKTHWTEKFNQVKENQNKTQESSASLFNYHGVDAISKRKGNMCKAYFSSNSKTQDLIGKKKLSPIVTGPRSVITCSSSHLSLIEEVHLGQKHVALRRSYLDTIMMPIFGPGGHQYVTNFPPRSYVADVKPEKEQRMRFPNAVKKVVTQISKRRGFHSDLYDPYKSAERQMMELLEPEAEPPKLEPIVKTPPIVLASPTSAFTKFSPIHSPQPLFISEEDNRQSIKEETKSRHSSEKSDSPLTITSFDNLSSSKDSNQNPISLSTLSLCSTISIESVDGNKNGYRLGYSNSAKTVEKKTPVPLRRTVSAYESRRGRDPLKGKLKMEDMLYGSTNTDGERYFGSPLITGQIDREDDNHSSSGSLFKSAYDAETLNAEQELLKSMCEFEKLLSSSSSSPSPSSPSLKLFPSLVSSCRPEDPQPQDVDLRTVTQSGGPDSAYSSLNRKSPVGGEGDPEKEVSTDSSAVARFCHECGAKYPVLAAKFCCQCGVRRLVI